MKSNMNDHNTNNNNNPYLQIAPAPPGIYGHDPYGGRPMSRFCEVLNQCGRRVEVATRKAEVYADNFWHHLKVSPSFTNAAMARIVQGAKLLTEGGHDKVFHQTFGTLPGEELVKAYACYLSTTTGPVIGTLYITNKRVAFCSDYPFAYHTSSGQQQWMYYKVVIQLDQMRSVNPSSNRINPSEKYMQIVTRDGHDFWFMGFISFDKALKHLTDALLPRSGDSATEIPVFVSHLSP